MPELLNTPISQEDLHKSDVLKASEITREQANSFGEIAIKDAIDIAQLLTNPIPHETTPDYKYKDNY